MAASQALCCLLFVAVAFAIRGPEHPAVLQTSKQPATPGSNPAPPMTAPIGENSFVSVAIPQEVQAYLKAVKKMEFFAQSIGSTITSFYPPKGHCRTKDGRVVEVAKADMKNVIPMSPATFAKGSPLVNSLDESLKKSTYWAAVEQAYPNFVKDSKAGTAALNAGKEIEFWNNVCGGGAPKVASADAIREKLVFDCARKVQHTVKEWVELSQTPLRNEMLDGWAACCPKATCKEDWNPFFSGDKTMQPYHTVEQAQDLLAAKGQCSNIYRKKRGCVLHIYRTVMVDTFIRMFDSYVKNVQSKPAATPVAMVETSDELPRPNLLEVLQRAH